MFIDEDYIVTFVNTPSLEKHKKMDYFTFKFFSRLSSLKYDVLEFSSRFLAFQVFGTNTIDKGLTLVSFQLCKYMFQVNFIFYSSHKY